MQSNGLICALPNHSEDKMTSFTSSHLAFLSFFCALWCSLIIYIFCIEVYVLLCECLCTLWSQDAKCNLPFGILSAIMNGSALNNVHFSGVFQTWEEGFFCPKVNNAKAWQTSCTPRIISLWRLLRTNLMTWGTTPSLKRCT